MFQFSFIRRRKCNWRYF